MKDYYLVNPNDLIHYGTRRHSGRYPYGSGERPYQGEEKVGYFQRKKQERYRAAAAKKKAEKLQKAREARSLKIKYEREKEKALKQGMATDVLKYKTDLTSKELQDVVTRLNLESQLKKYSSKEIETNMSRIDKIMKNVKTMTEWAIIGTAAWNTIANIYNTTSYGKINPLTLIKKIKE